VTGTQLASKPTVDSPQAKQLIRPAIAGLGISVPPKVVTNAELEKLVDTTNEWIVTRTGISERRISDPTTATSDLCIEAARRSLQDAKLSPEALDLIIVCTVTPDAPVPATACIVQDRLGAKNAAAFDLNGGCTGFMYGVAVGSQFVSSGMYKHVMIIGADLLSRIVDWTDRTTCILFGDGAGSAIISAAEREDQGILDFHLRSDGSGRDLLRIEAGGTKCPTSQETVDQKLHFLRMEGRQVFKFAVHAILDGVNTLLKRNHLEVDDIDCFIFHQANLRILENASKHLKIPPEKIFTNVHRYGNTSSASVPLALEEARQAKKFKKGSTIILVGFGAGLSWASSLIRW